MRVCMFTETALPKVGGQEVVVDALSRALSARGHQITVLAQRPRWRYKVDDARYPYPVFRHPRFWSTHRFVDFYRRYLVQHYRRHPFDVLHCHSVYPTGYLSSLVREQLGVPVVITSHGGDVYAGNARLRKRGLPERFSQSLRAADALVAISRFNAAEFDKLDARHAPTIQIPNGVDLAPFAIRPPRPAQLDARVEAGKYVLFLGRLSRRKGVDLLIEAMAQLAAKHPGLILVVAGDGDEREELEAVVRERGLARQIVFTGTVRGEAKTWLLQNALTLVVASRGWEAFGLVVVEAYAAGRPAIVTDLPGLADLIEPEQTGLVVPAESSGALAGAIDRLVSDPALADRWGVRAAALAQQYSWAHVAQWHEALYGELLAKHRQRAAA
ncbi:MAG: glycosyltransferase family 4 protein [Planctomycetes bacterium]|nr:glycosyltransferase family 4 protein [Planctomycetota bacterium]